MIRRSRRSQLVAATDYFERVFGSPYPHPELGILEIDSWGWGQAPAGIIFITSEAYNPLGMVIEGYHSRGVNARLLHEIAHGWWGHVIKMGSWEEQWLGESFAEYASALAGQHISGQPSRVRRSEGHSHALQPALRQGAASTPCSPSGAGRREPSSEEKGDQYFLALWRSMIKSFPYRWGETRHLVGILNQMTGKDWQPWFERYVYGTETPRVDLK